MIITGAAGGIGRAAARRFASEGATVVAVDLVGSDIEATADAVAAEGGEVTTVTAGAAALDAHGRVDALFNNAGIEGPIASLVDYPADDFERIMDVNVRGVWLGIKHAGPAIASSGGGAIVNTASRLGTVGLARMGAYVASKHAVIGLTRTAALEFAPLDVRVNAVAPAPVDTPMIRSIEQGMNPDGGGRGCGVPVQRRRRLHDRHRGPHRRRLPSSRLSRPPRPDLPGHARAGIPGASAGVPLSEAAGAPPVSPPGRQQRLRPAG